MTQYQTVLSIAGSDSGAGAGIQADIKTIMACGAYGMTAITALTAQNTMGVQQVMMVNEGMVRAQLHSIFSDMPVHAIKIGMLAEANIIDVVSDVLADHVKSKQIPVVWDPVMVAKGGASLLNPKAMSAMKESPLWGLTRLLTPNLLEARALVDGGSDLQGLALAQALQAKGALAVLLKGGHDTGDETHVRDLLLDGDESAWFSYPRIFTRHTHGTGCTLSAAIAAFLAQGCGLYESVSRARAYLQQAILVGSEYELGRGHGPLFHDVKTN